MDKQSVLQAIRTLASEGEITEAEVTAAVRAGSGGDAGEVARRHSRYSRVLYFVGGGVVVIGIVALIAQVWDDLGSFMRIVVTLGSGVAAYVVGVLLSRYRRLGAAGPAFFLIAALVLPLGMVVMLDEAGLDPEQLGLQSLVSAALMVAFLAAYSLFKANSVLAYAIVYGTWFVFGITGWMVGSDPRFPETEFFEYRALAVGLAYMVLGYAFTGSERQGLSGGLYGIGCLGFLGAAFALGGWKPSQNVFWELVFPGLVFVVLYASVHLKSKVLFTFGSLFLGAYLVKITSEYFSDTLGWPLALVIAGLLLMAVGYLTLRLKQAYLTD